MMAMTTLEALLVSYLWAMYGRDHDYGFIHLCSWPLDAFTYDGVCSHNPFQEGVGGEFDVSVEQPQQITNGIKSDNPPTTQPTISNQAAWPSQNPMQHRSEPTKSNGQGLSSQDERLVGRSCSPAMHATTLEMMLASLGTISWPKTNRDTNRVQKCSAN